MSAHCDCGHLQVYLYMLSAFTRKFGHSGVFTIYQDFAMHTIGLTLSESGLTGTIYGGAAVGGVVLVMISHALRWQYSKLVSLVISSVMNTVFIISLTAAVSKVRANNDHSQNVNGSQRDVSLQIKSAETQKFWPKIYFIDTFFGEKSRNLESCLLF